MFTQNKRAIREDFLPTLLDKTTIGENLHNYIVLEVKQKRLLIPDRTASTAENYFKSVELNFSIRRIKLFYLSGIHVDMYPYPVANIKISNVDKIKVVAAVSLVPKYPAADHHHN